MSASAVHALSAAVEAGEHALRMARLPAETEAAARMALSGRGHLFGDDPRWARLFLAWIDALVGPPLDPFVPSAVACEYMAAGYDLLDELYDRKSAAPRERVARYLPAGLSLLLLAQESVARLDVDAARRVRAAWVLARAGRRAFAGQVADDELRAAPAAELTTVLAVMRRRAGTLVAAPCQCAALLVGAHWRVVALAGHFGRALGCAAQLEDDLADRGEDARSGKKTIPLLLQGRYTDNPALVDAAAWVLHRRFHVQAAQALARLSREQVNVEVLWTLLPGDLRTS